jgi:FixJ family two-component response regulator
MQSDAIVAIVDEDPSVRKGLEQRLIRSLGCEAETFASAQARGRLG